MNSLLNRRLFWLLALVAAGIGLAVLAACATPHHFDVTPTPTRTPRPTATATPTPTPTPAWPVTVGCDDGVPETACALLRARADQDPVHLAWAEGDSTADIRLTSEATPNTQPVGTWTYAVAAPFFTLDDEVALADLQAAWAGSPSGPLAGHPLLVSPDTESALSDLWGLPPSAVVQTALPDELLAQAIRLDGWAILPFDQLGPRWKVLRVDGVSLLEKGLDPGSYPLSFPLYLVVSARPDALPLLPTDLSNRDESRMAVVAMTGVTALTRGTAQTMERMGVTYPAQDIGAWLQEADLTHISNEVSFTPDCPVPPQLGTMTFCSHDRYIGLLEAVGTDIVELTGNHNNDYGTAPDLHTLEMFRERGWRWFGGGANLAEATRPLTITLGPNRLAFLGCNSFDPPDSRALATETTPGAASCREPEDLELMLAEVPGNASHEDAHQHGNAHGHETHGQGHPGTLHHAGEHVASQVIGSQQVDAKGWNFMGLQAVGGGPGQGRPQFFLQAHQRWVQHRPGAGSQNQTHQGRQEK